MELFERTRLLLGRDAMKKLNDAHILVAGLGAVGSYAVEGLARAGLGALTVVDFDEIKASNVNRQLYALHSTLGRQKTQVSKDRIQDINPMCEVHALDTFVDDKTIPEILSSAPDVVIDAIDSLNSKAAIIACAHQLGIPLVSCMGAATKTDPSAIRVGDLSETFGCPLARLLRKRLRKRGVHKGVMCIFSTESAPVPGAKAEAEILGEIEKFDRGRARHVLGSFSCVTGIFGLIAAREAIFKIIDTDQSASGRRNP